MSKWPVVVPVYPGGLQLTWHTDSPAGLALLAKLAFSWPCLFGLPTVCCARLLSALFVQLADSLPIAPQMAFCWPSLSSWPKAGPLLLQPDSAVSPVYPAGQQLAYSQPSWQTVSRACPAGLQLALHVLLVKVGLSLARWS
jgi:hypothetical protein